MRSVNECTQRFGSRWSEMEVEAAMWKLIGDAAAQGRLLIDLSEVELSRFTAVAFLDEGVLPASSEQEDDQVLDPQGVVPGPPFDASILETAEQQAHFHRNLAAVTEVLSGKSLGAVAKAYEMRSTMLSYLVKRTRAFGQLACVPYGTYHRNRTLRPEFEHLIRKLYTQPLRPSIMAVCEDVRLKKLAEELSSREGSLVLVPT